MRSLLAVAIENWRLRRRERRDTRVLHGDRLVAAIRESWRV